MLATTKARVVPRPFLKWAGGKNKLIQQYQPYFPKTFKTYYEPFLGGGAIFFYLFRYHSPFGATLTDVNQELINVYHCIKTAPSQVISLLADHQKNHNPDYYYKIRGSISNSDHEKAARLIYLNKTCFNGLYRENSKGQFNVPLGRYKNPQICNSALIESVSAALQNVQLEVRRFEEVLNYANSKEDFVYLDPPYHPLSQTSKFTAYSRYAFGEDDQLRLRDVFAELDRRGVQVMLSNSDCPFIRQLYHDFNIHPILASRAINSNINKRGKIPEVLVTSY
ncbi:MAG TPA: DNA methyltransferase [Cyanobacteria bacterium UBA8803]|nr:DNA methyltransferase [Cyanobacteria bacterium UBA9273]HBL57166.1 DNA methyltransferase [Cyanobacteria bacterium UBA8803]